MNVQQLQKHLCKPDKDRHFYSCFLLLKLPNHIHWKAHQNIKKRASTVPKWGKHLAPSEKAPCPKWASTVPKTVPKVSIEGNVSKGI